MRCVQDPKFPWQVPDNSEDMGATPLHLVRTIVAQQYRNAGRQQGQKEEQNAIVSGWIGWIHSPEKAKTQRRIKRETAMGGSRCHISPTMSHSFARGNPTLIKTGINKAACCRGGPREQIKKIILGTLSWQFSLMSQFDRMDKGKLSPAKCVNKIGDKTSSYCSNSTIIMKLISRKRNIIFCNKS